MRFVLAFLVLFALACSKPAQAPSSPQTAVSKPAGTATRVPKDGTLYTAVDPASGQVLIRTDDLLVISDRGPIEVLVGGIVQNPSLIGVGMLIQAHSPILADCRDMQIVVDGVPMQFLGSPGYIANPIPDGLQEMVMTQTSYMELWRLAHAKQASGSLCNSSFVFTPGQLVTLQQLADKLSPHRQSVSPVGNHYKSKR